MSHVNPSNGHINIDGLPVQTLQDRVRVGMKLTKAQQRSVLAKFQQNPDGHASYRSMRRSCTPDFGWNETAMMRWCGMWLGIEPDGYTHS